MAQERIQDSNQEQSRLSGAAQTIDKPQRWDLPFSRDFPNEIESRDLTENELDQLLEKEPFSAMDASRFPKSLPLREILRNDTRIRSYRNGDAVVRVGDYGNSAYLILEGDCRAIIEGLDQSALGRISARPKGFLGSLKNIFTNPSSPEVRDASLYPQFADKDNSPKESNSSDQVFVQDVPNVLELVPDVYEKTTNNIMPAGSLFGELGALGRVQRSVTVIASDPERTKLLEIRWQGLRDLMKFDNALRDHVNKIFRTRGLRGALQSSPLLASAELSQEQWAQVVAEAEFETFGSYDWYGTYQQLREKDVDPLSQEPIIAEAGQYPNGLIMVRAGFGRLSQEHGYGVKTFGYLGKGDVYGLEELMHNVKKDAQLPLQTTLRAAGYMDIVRIPTRTFEKIIYPTLLAARARQIKNSSSVVVKGGDRRKYIRRVLDIKDVTEHGDGVAPKAANKEDNFDPSMMEFLVENRLINGTQTMLINLDRCTRCDDCVRACASGHSNNPRFVRHGRIHGHHMIANACMHCVDPVCMIGCPTGAIHRSESGEVVINDLTCIGCTTCANSCPYENIRMVNVRDQSEPGAIMVDPTKGRPIVKATKCDLCVDYNGGPACERACPHDALKRVDMNDLDFLSDWLNK